MRALGDERHLLFECPDVQLIKNTYIVLFQVTIMQVVVAKGHCGGCAIDPGLFPHGHAPDGHHDDAGDVLNQS